MARILSNESMTNLRSGILRTILEYVIMDPTLDLNIREDYINIYYRGGNILRVKEISSNNYKFHFDANYIKGRSKEDVGKLVNLLNTSDWNSYFPFAKMVMDSYFYKHVNAEREYAQLVARENNYSPISNGTDIFIIDLEYDNHHGARFDLVGLHWPSKASTRKLSKSFKPSLVVIEMKYGDHALKGAAGLGKHVEDFSNFLNRISQVKQFREEMTEVFRQKRILGLIPCLSVDRNPNQVIELGDSIDLIFLIANHDPASKVLGEQFDLVTKMKFPFDIQYVSSNLMGYGLYQENIKSIKNFPG